MLLVTTTTAAITTTTKENNDNVTTTYNIYSRTCAQVPGRLAYTAMFYSDEVPVTGEDPPSIKSSRT